MTHAQDAGIRQVRTTLNRGPGADDQPVLHGFDGERAPRESPAHHRQS